MPFALAGPGVLRAQRLDGLPGPGISLPRGHGWRGPVCRYGALRRASDSPGLVHVRLSCTDVELSGAGGADDAPAGRDREPLLPDGSRLGPLPDGPPGHRGHGHRLPGLDLRSLLVDDAGRSVRFPAAAEGPTHLRPSDRPDLRALRELVADAGLHRSGRRIRQFQQPGGGLRGCRHGHHADHHLALLLSGALRMGVVGGACRTPVWTLLGDRGRILGRKPAEDCPWGLVPPGGGDGVLPW